MPPTIRPAKLAGWGDALSFGLTRKIRGAVGWNDAVNFRSTSYKAGAVTGTVHGAAILILSGQGAALTGAGLGGLTAGFDDALSGRGVRLEHTAAAAAAGAIGGAAFEASGYWLVRIVGEAGAASLSGQVLSGAIAGAGGDITYQVIMVTSGQQRAYSTDQLAFAIATGGVLGGASKAVHEVFVERYSPAAPEGGVTWNNGWRTADGKFASPRGPGRAGGSAESAAWDAVETKHGWEVVRGRVHVRDASGQLRVYDGAAISPKGRVIGLEVKSGSGKLKPNQRAFDTGLNSSCTTTAQGVGRSSNLEIRRALKVQQP